MTYAWKLTIIGDGDGERFERRSETNWLAMLGADIEQAAGDFIKGEIIKEEVRTHPMFLGWYDPNRNASALSKVTEAIERYQEKFGRLPEVCLTNHADAAELGDTCPIPVRPVTFIARFTYYVGIEEPA